jgi:pyridoxamine 5'-phosphate oxidase
MEKSLADIRKEYMQQSLEIKDLHENPFEQFNNWYKAASASGNPEPTAMCLCTADKDGKPAGRMVLLKGLDTGFIFYTNFESRKSLHLQENPFAALTFFWPELERQVRIEGKVEVVESHIVDAYFKSRPVGSQIGAYASPQSRAISSRATLEQRVAEFEKEWPFGPPQRPDFWGGYRLLPSYFEFWQGRPSRLHDRLVYEKSGQNWLIKRLAP